MRAPFSQAMSALDPERSVFLTGDLGFMALEPVRDALGPRFINAGVAEQNMVSVAAGLAKSGLEPWVYSIAPFCYARPFEQIRNDVCHHGLGVRLVGNGGGYGYGVMGASHHAIEDYGALLTLRGLRVFIPAFDEDVPVMVDRIRACSHPTYLRLGRCEKPAGFVLPPYAPWRRVLEGPGPVMVYAGPVAGGHLRAFLALDPARRPEVWIAGELPLAPPPAAWTEALCRRRRLWTVEEHVATGGLGQSLAALVLAAGWPVTEFRPFHAQGYPSGRGGSQEFHRRESGLDADTLAGELMKA